MRALINDSLGPINAQASRCQCFRAQGSGLPVVARLGRGSLEKEKVHGFMCVGLVKLVLASMISDKRVLKSLVVDYLSSLARYGRESSVEIVFGFPMCCY
ncbi:hypothetical protein OG21DRAFT_603679 [Imleria badia]|nr:hypothetical protein OG21DRAFT_603679 [Imleria badia]